jgi:hypothetical protein
MALYLSLASCMVFDKQDMNGIFFPAPLINSLVNNGFIISIIIGSRCNLVAARTIQSAIRMRL